MTFSDGIKGRVLDKGTLNTEWFLRLKGVLHVDGFEANLLSMSQIYDLNLHVNFTCDKCIVIDRFGNCVLERSQSLNNYYTLSQPHTCYHVFVDDTDLYYEKLGHLNYKTLSRFV